MDHTKQERKLSYCSRRRDHAVSTGRWGFSRRQRGHDHRHGDRKHSDASRHDITEYICCSGPTAVYITRGSWGFFGVFVQSEIWQRFEMQKRRKSFHSEVYCLKIQLQQSTFAITVHTRHNRGVHTLYMLFGDRWEVDIRVRRVEIPAIKPVKTSSFITAYIYSVKKRELCCTYVKTEHTGGHIRGNLLKNMMFNESLVRHRGHPTTNRDSWAFFCF